jgi:tetratricopeptide (TPR) repeat protein
MKELRTLERLGRLGTLHVLAVRNNIARSLDNMGEVRAALEQLRTTVREDQVKDTSVALHPVFSQTYGLLLSRAGNHQLALEWFNRAVRDAAAGVGGAGAELTARVRLAREHALSGCVAEAAQDLAAIDSGVAGHEEELAGAIQALPIARAEYELAKGDAAAAEASISSLLASTADSTAPTTRGTRMRLLEVAVPAALAQGRPQQAEALADERVRLARTRARNPSVSVDVGEAYLSRALVLAAEGHSAEARTAAREARQVLTSSLGDAHASTRAAARLADGENQLRPGSRIESSARAGCSN